VKNGLVYLSYINQRGKERKKERRNEEDILNEDEYNICFHSDYGVFRKVRCKKVLFVAYTNKSIDFGVNDSDIALSSVEK
jgi:hypothetical protein